MPLLTVDTPDSQFRIADSDVSSVVGDEDERRVKRWWHYIPIFLIIVFIFGCQLVIFKILVSYYLPTGFKGYDVLLITTHLLAMYTLTFLAISSLIVCVVRDPGSVSGAKSPSNQDSDFRPLPTTDQETRDEPEIEMSSLADALMDGPDEDWQDEVEDDFNSPAKWCKRCWAPKPERTHHCSVCGRCVLKLDHHCPWLSTCVGHWTHTAFLHFLLCVTLLSSYAFFLCGHIVWIAFSYRQAVTEEVAVYSLIITMIGAVFAMSMGSFLLYHVYLVTTNQTTLESLSPFLLLRYLPRTPSSTHTSQGYPIRFSNPPLEHELSSKQRRCVRRAHSSIRMYDVGWRQNWMQVIAWNRKWGWVRRILYGGGGLGDGKKFPHNPRSHEMLARLAVDLFDDDKLA